MTWLFQNSYTPGNCSRRVGGILVGLGVGLFVQKFPVMPVLYGLSQWRGSVAVQGQRIVYEVPDVLTGPDKLKHYELDLVPL